LENLFERQNGEQLIAMERRKIVFWDGGLTAAAH
jgi:hypothetical protein